MSVYFIFNYVWGVIYRIGQVKFKWCFFANSCFVLNVCKVVMFRVLWLCIFEFGIKFQFCKYFGRIL